MSLSDGMRESEDRPGDGSGNDRSCWCGLCLDAGCECCSSGASRGDHGCDCLCDECGDRSWIERKKHYE